MQLKLRYDGPVLDSAFKFDLRRYNEVRERLAGGGGGGAGGAGANGGASGDGVGVGARKEEQ
jgi:hypothetical protein